MHSFKTQARRLAVGAAASLMCVPVFADNITPDLQFNGYATAGMAWTHDAHGAQYLYNGNATNSPSITSDPTMDYDSVVGLQFNYRVNDRTNLMTQLVANEAAGDFAVKANWAYIAYRLNDDFTLRAGRFAFPTYLYSENLYVGEAYPWARLPAEIYGTLDGFYNLNGVDLLYRKGLGDWNLTVQPVLGNATLPAATVNKARGLTVNLSNDNLTLHAGTILGSVNIDATSTAVGQELIAATDASVPPAAVPAVNAQLASAINLQNDRASYSDVGALYDDGKWFAAGELAELRFQGWPQDFNAGYASVGHYFGQFLPYVLYSRIKTVNNDENGVGFPPSLAPVAAALAQADNKEQSSLAIGLRYQLRPNVSVKAQVDRISNFQGSNGLFTFVTTPQTQPLGPVYLYSLSLSTAF